MPNQEKGKAGYLQAWEEAASLRDGMLTDIRQHAKECFAKLGFPTTKNEEWKYTNISPVLAHEFHSNLKDHFVLTLDDVRPFLLAGKTAHVMVFENGRFNLSLSNLPVLNSEFVIDRLANHLHHPVVQEHLGRYARYQEESFIALNTAFVNDGAFISIPANQTLEQQIHLLFINDTRKEPTVVYPRNLIVVEKHASVKIVESYHSIGNVNHGFTNSVTEVVVQENAQVDFTRILTENNLAYHIGHTEAFNGKNSNFNISTISLGGLIVRNNLHIVMNGVNGQTNLYGLSIADGNSLMDNHTLVDHAAPMCYSNELYKSILDDKSQGVFNGKIMVRQDAQKTNAYQSNKNLLLSDEASMYTKPQLEIFADDVKCSHGATTGQIDREALFYLRSRGIGEELAKTFLNLAFAADVISNIRPESLRDRLLHLIEEKLKSKKK